MRKLGLIGGIGPESTVLYYQKIVYGVQQRMKKDFFPNLTIESLSVFAVLDYCRRKDYQGLTDYVAEGLAHLAAAGCDMAALTGNTPHIVFDALQKRSSIPLISMPVAACKEAQKRGYTSLGPLGTFVTMQESFFKIPFQEAGIRVSVPTDKEQEYVSQCIEKELEQGVVKKTSQDTLLAIVQRMQKEENVQAVILGCTELPLAFASLKTPIPTLDTMAIHIQELIDCITDERAE